MSAKVRPPLRALNRSLLARQGLLERTRTPPAEMVERLVGLQAQVPSNPYVALWSRLADFDPAELSDEIEAGRMVRAGLMRCTLHLVTARDHDALQPVMAAVLARTFQSQFAKYLGGVDRHEVAAAAKTLLPATRAELGRGLSPAFPEAPAEILGHAAVHHLPVVQTPPRGLWLRSAQARWSLRPDQGARPPDPVDEIVLRYLRAFGPATAADVRTWSGLTGLREVMDRLDLVELGGGLLDVRDAPWPDPETPAPPRFLPDYDNLLLSHADRSRVVDSRVAPPGGPFHGTLLIDGFTAASWNFTNGKLTFQHEIPRTARDEVEAEAAALAAFLAT